jgi:CRISPR-associated protein Cas1
VADVGLINLESVVLWGASASTAAVRLLLYNGVPLVFLDKRGHYLGRLESRWSGTSQLRNKQRPCFDQHAVTLSREVVSAKVHNQARVLEKWMRRGAKDLADTVKNLKEWSLKALRETSLESLRGLEGAATREYFRAVSKALPTGFTRSSRPPKDLINAALSTAYYSLMERCLAAVSVVGFDPYAGFFHTAKHGKPSLALDLMEPLRPVVDRVIFGAVRKRQIKPDYADHRDGGCYLTPEGFEFVLTMIADTFRRKLVYKGQRWEIAVIPVEMARSLARFALESEDFEAFRLQRD